MKLYFIPAAYVLKNNHHYKASKHKLVLAEKSNRFPCVAPLNCVHNINLPNPRQSSLSSICFLYVPTTLYGSNLAKNNNTKYNNKANFSALLIVLSLKSGSLSPSDFNTTKKKIKQPVKACAYHRA